ncbi:uncharacterized protein LOC110669829 [Hevea brasiliensis]|uniref:uncharacterized protein LOC110669829 n=1 Tax=Hevea brasiliensis TaxID=3981 RepID=UPI0025DCFCFD|nr:uncharacterized protein LOC110669829 [Hevea brasiliensis]
MAIEHELQTHLNSNYKIFASNIRLLLGYLAIVQLALIHVLIYGLLLLGLWFYLVIRVAVNPCEDLCLLVGRDLQNLKRLAEDAIQRLFGRQETFIFKWEAWNSYQDLYRLLLQAFDELKRLSRNAFQALRRRPIGGGENNIMQEPNHQSSSSVKYCLVLIIAFSFMLRK